MASKREELAAFNKFKKMFPGRSTSLSCQYQSWREQPEYYAYLEGKGEEGSLTTICEYYDTPDKAIKSILNKRKEANALRKLEESKKVS